jgi:hypothetical protein
LIDENGNVDIPVDPDSLVVGVDVESVTDIVYVDVTINCEFDC